MDKLTLAIVLPFVIWFLVIAWLFYATFGKKTINLSVKGLGMSVTIDTQPARQRRCDDDPS